jgi:hypothetical protein
MGQIGPFPKEGRVRDDSRRHDSKVSSSGVPKPERCKGVSALVVLHRTLTYFLRKVDKRR